MSVDIEPLSLIQEFLADTGGRRVNKIKLKDNGDFVQIYIDNGQSRNGTIKNAGIRIYKNNLKMLKQWLDMVELKG